MRQLRTCYLTLMYKEKRVCKFFVVPRSGSALLGMPDTEILAVLTKLRNNRQAVDIR